MFPRFCPKTFNREILSVVRGQPGIQSEGTPVGLGPVGGWSYWLHPKLGVSDGLLYGRTDSDPGSAF